MRKIPKDISDVYEALWNEVSLVTFKWHTFKQLFSISEERLRLLEKTANGFFHICENSILSDVLISLSRITDNPGSKKGAKISLGRLVFVKGPYFTKETAKEFEELVKKAETNCNGIRSLRNNLYGHLSFGVIQDPQLDELPDVTVGQVDKAIKSVQAVITFFAFHVHDEDHRFDLGQMVGGADALVFHLERALKAFDDDVQQIAKS